MASETTPEIIAEMRAWTADDHADPCEVSLNVSLFADRLEAAIRREAGNTAKMRETLAEIRLLLVKVPRSIRSDVACGIIAAKAKHALAAPPRNCDVYTTTDEARWAYHMHGYGLATMQTFCDWFLAPVADKESGVAK